MYNDKNLKQTHKQREEITFRIKPRRSKRARKEKFYCEVFFDCSLLENEPRNFTNVVYTPKAPSRKETINSKINSIMKNHTWYIAYLLNGFKALSVNIFSKQDLKIGGWITSARLGL